MTMKKHSCRFGRFNCLKTVAVAATETALMRWHLQNDRVCVWQRTCDSKMKRKQERYRMRTMLSIQAQQVSHMTWTTVWSMVWAAAGLICSLRVLYNWRLYNTYYVQSNKVTKTTTTTTTSKWIDVDRQFLFSSSIYRLRFNGRNASVFIYCARTYLCIDVCV